MKNFFKNIKPVWWFYLTATVLLFFNLGSAPLWASEDRWAEVARSMWLTGDWLHPAINGTVYFDKPLLTYWPIALLAVITGMMNEFIVRMPCVLAALAGLWGTRDLARRVSGGDEKTVNYSGWLLLGCYAYFFWARTAAAEMMNLTMILLAVDWFFMRREKPGFVTCLIFWLIAFLGAWAKGLPALILPPAIVAVLVFSDGSFKKHLTLPNILKNSGAFLCCAAIWITPFYLAAITAMPEYYQMPTDHNLSGLGLVWRENIVRAIAPFDHDKEPFYIYFVHVPRLMLPYTLAVLAALAAAVLNWKKLSTERRWLWLSAAVIFILFSLSRSRRWYYILPIMPFLAIPTAAWIAENGKWSEIIRKIYYWLLVAAAITGILLVVALGLFWQDTNVWAIIQLLGPAVIIPAVAVLMVILVILRENRNWRGVIAAVTLAVALGFSVIYPAIRNLHSDRIFAAAMRKNHPQLTAAEMIYFRNEYPKLNFYLQLDRPVAVAWNADTLKQQLNQLKPGQKVYIITQERYNNDLFSAGVTDDLTLSFREIPPEELTVNRKKSTKDLYCWEYLKPQPGAKRGDPADFPKAKKPRRKRGKRPPEPAAKQLQSPVDTVAL